MASETSPVLRCLRNQRDGAGVAEATGLIGPCKRRVLRFNVLGSLLHFRIS